MMSDIPFMLPVDVKLVKRERYRETAMFMDEFSTYFEQYTWAQNFECNGDSLLSRIADLMLDGNVRRLIVCQPDGAVILEVPINPGLNLLPPTVAALRTVANTVSRVKLEIVRTEEIPQWGTD
jgi:hypothetical protein